MGSERRLLKNAGGRLALGLQQYNNQKQANALATHRLTGVVSPTATLGISRPSGLSVYPSVHVITKPYLMMVLPSVPLHSVILLKAWPPAQSDSEVLAVRISLRTAAVGCAV